MLSKSACQQRTLGSDISVLDDIGSPLSEICRLTVVLADDHAVVRAGLRSLLSSVDWISVVAETSTDGAVREAVLHRPDVLILGQWRQPESGSVIGELVRSAPGVAILVFSMAEDDESVFAAIRAGAGGYLRNAAERDDILRAICAVSAGWVIFSPQIGSRLATMLSGSTVQARPFPDLTAREFDVLTLVAAGLPNASIAAELNLAPKTISNYLSRIFAKLGVADRANAIVRARDAGLGSSP
ncbi:LuxR C-terminal-related transcriptional regulator [Nocardia iowensis]|uniref:Response regulator transcription factor n=1 Tax=Nocardia iowensis TaxID=204891 RepID=A0ABX8RWI0_NOCIO|nr:response regulator transcription factor [Nocardia iowensis]QXN94015.1 response regulator transcription factor [Nocardia iowensis]